MQYQYLQACRDENGNTLIGVTLFGEALIKEANRHIYEVVFNGALNVKNPETQLDLECALDAIYQIHNRNDRPLRHKIRSMSKGDLIVILGRVFIVDSVGFEELTGNNTPQFDNPEPVVN